MSGLDFRNLIGRVGRIQFNLCGNVFFVSDESSIKQDDYLKLLRDDIKEQKLSLVQDLKPKHKKQIARTLLSGSTIIDKYNDDQPEEEYIMMRKFAVILLRDIVDNRDSLVRKEFSKFLSTEDENIVRSTFSENAKLLDNDINISLDQTKRLRAAIIMDPEFSYPKPDKNGYFVHGDVVDFLSRLGDVFNWKKYEYSTLGKVNENGDYSRLGWYATILVQWMEVSWSSYFVTVYSKDVLVNRRSYSTVCFTTSL